MNNQEKVQELTGKDKIIKSLQDNQCSHVTLDTIFGVKAECPITISIHGIDYNHGEALAPFDKFDNDVLHNIAYEVEQQINSKSTDNSPEV